MVVRLRHGTQRETLVLKSARFVDGASHFELALILCLALNAW